MAAAPAPLARAAWATAAAGAAVVVVHLVLAPADGHGWAYPLAIAQLVVALALGAAIHRPGPRVVAPLALLVACLAVGQVLDERSDGDATGGAALAAAIAFLAVQVVLVGGLVATIRRRLGRDPGDVLADAAIVALGAWCVIWIALLEPRERVGAADVAVVAVAGATLAGSAVVVFVLAWLLLSDARQSAAAGLVAGAIGASILGDLAYAAADAGRLDVAPHLAYAPSVLSLFLASAAVLHPSAASLASPAPGRTRTPLRARVLLTTAALVVPVVVLTLASPAGTADRVVRATSIAVLAAVVMLRVGAALRANAELQRRLVASAQTDALTGLSNRLLMLEHVAGALARAHEDGRKPAVLFIDVDRFKNINDSLGHQVGDDVLMAVAQRLRVALPARCIVGRISGDEFVVLDAEAREVSDAMLVADHVLEAFREPLPLRQGDVFVSTSVGVAIHQPGVSTTAEDLLRHADTAMYRAKEAGRNCVAVFDESMLRSVTHRLELETALYRALERRELRLVHQPIVDVRLGDVVGFEALMRWQREDGRPVSPAEFIPIAEETGTILPIGAWALLEALTHLGEWIAQGACQRGATMSVNVSPRQLHDPNFVAVVNEALLRARIPADQLWIEITEGVMISQPAQALTTLRRLADLGVRIAIDDFGTGYSSLAFLQKFPIHCLKIDRTFVAGILEDANAGSIVQTIVAMAGSLSLDVVAEGVESVQQLHALADLGCAKAQGYLISHPVAPERMPQALASLDEIGKWPRLRPL
ncbi:MAG: putative bifunctional diguanylate cyclase/phosphodiesterase [Ilumatobacteraceae bacterium]